MSDVKPCASRLLTFGSRRMTLIFCDFLLFVGGALLFDDDDDDGGASIASGLSLVELSFDIDDDDDDVDFVTTAICCAGLKTTKYK